MVAKISENKVKEVHKVIEQVKKEISKIVVGQEEIVGGLIKSLICNGHVLVEGIPGIAKTLLIRAIAVVSGCQFKRIQFTVDLLPSDIVGITTYEEKKGFFTIKGPIFTNFVVADEINRAPPKSQSSLLEAMQERQTTIGKITYPMMKPFFVMATQNPIETAGTYPLPEAQIDRFLFKILMTYPNQEEERLILKTNISLYDFEDFKIKPILNPKKILQLQNIVKDVYINKDVEEYIVRLVHATREPEKYKIKSGKYIAWAASPRASIGIFIAAKADALIRGYNFVTPQNVKNVAHDVCRHRILLTYEGEAENINTDDIISEILSKVPIP